MLIKYDGKSMLKRILCMILLLILAIMPIMIPAAQAVVAETLLTARAIYIVGGLLIVGGVAFANSDIAKDAAGRCWSWIQDHSATAVEFITTWAQKYTGFDRDVGVRVSQGIWDVLAEAYNNVFESDDSVGYSARVENQFTDAEWKDFYTLFETFQPQTVSFVYGKYNISFKMYYERHDNEIWGMYEYNGSIKKDMGRDFIDSYTYYIAPSSYGSTEVQLNFMAKTSKGSLGFQDFCWFVPYPFTFSFGGVLPAPTDLVFPSDDSIVKAPDLPDVVTDADGKELVVYPELPLNPADHLADIPLNPEGQKVEVPFDVPVDLSTGKALDDVENPDKPGEGEGEGGNTGIWDWLKDLLQKILDAINGLIGALLDGLKALLVSLFVPGEGFLTDAFNDMLSPLQNKLPIGAYTDLVSKLQNVGAKELQNVQVTLYGQTVTIIDWGYYKANKATFDDIIRGFVFVLLLAYNINNIYKLVRNNDVLGKRRDEKL